MARKSNEAVAAMCIAVLLAAAVAGNYTLAKDEVKHLNDEKPTTGEAEDKAKSWFGSIKELVKQIIPGTKVYERTGSEKVREVGEMKEKAKESVPDAFTTFSDKEKVAANKRVEDTEAKVTSAKEKAKDTLDAAKKKASESYEAVKEKAEETLDAAKKAAKNVYDKTKKKKENTDDGGRESYNVIAIYMSSSTTEIGCPF